MFSKIKRSRNILLFILVVISFCFSCKNPQLEQLQGIWIGAHRGDTSLISTNNLLLQVNGKRATLIRFATDIATDFERDDEVLELNILLKNGETIFMNKKEEVFYLNSVNNDSLSLLDSFGAGQLFVFKKAPITFLKDSLTLSYFNNSAFIYELEGSNKTDTIDFINQTSFVERHNGENYVGHWHLETIAGFQFLVLGDFLPHAYLILSEKRGILKMKGFYDKDVYFSLKKMEIQQIGDLLQGQWEETGFTNGLPLPPLPPDMEAADPRLKLFFTQDSVSITEFGRISLRKYFLSPFNDYIFFPNGAYSGYFWKVKKISESQLQIHKSLLTYYHDSSREFILEKIIE